MKQRILTGVTLLLTLVAVFLAREFSKYIFDFFMLAICFLASFESSKLFGKMGLYNSWIVTMIYPALAYGCMLLSILNKLAWYYAIILQISLILFIIAICYFVFLIFNKKSNNEIKIRNLKISLSQYSFNKAVHTSFAMLYPSILLLLLIPLNHMSTMYSFLNITNLDKLSFFALLLAFLIPVLTDTFSMVVGTLFKGKKLCEKISPNKTISGAVGGVLVCVLLVACVFIIFDATAVYGPLFSTINLQIWHILILTVLASVVCQCGDLFESWLKRKAGVKDSGNIFPAHGGVLDRIDSHAFNAIIILLFFVILL